MKEKGMTALWHEGTCIVLHIASFPYVKLHMQSVIWRDNGLLDEPIIECFCHRCQPGSLSNISSYDLEDYFPNPNSIS